MPIIKPNKYTSPVFYPQKNYKVVKYIDLTKFVSLLQRNSLFFCRLDKLEDHFEGTTSKLNFERRSELFRTQHLASPNFNKLTQKEIEIKVEKYYEADEKFKALNCVCCWNKYKFESAALWKIYSDFHKGIMVKSNINKVISAFTNTKEKLSLSEIRYIDYNKDYMPDGNKMYPIIHKHKAYDFEEELRIIHTVDFGNGLVYDWKNEEVEYGKYLDVNLKELVDEIIISPYSSNWYMDLVKNLCETYRLNATIIKSELSKQ